jgi:hypothetical protein
MELTVPNDSNPHTTYRLTFTASAAGSSFSKTAN